MYKTIFRINILACLLFLYTHAEVANKRLPLGFQGTRGKKSIDMSTLDDVQENDNPLSLAKFQSYLLSQQPDHYYQYKRAPMGFMGMRGKKDSFYDGDLLPEDNVYDMEEKRALKGFQGMRGKKQIEYPIFSYPNKRKPSMGFQGMRGKKDIDNLFNTFGPQDKNADVNYVISNVPSYGSPYFTDLGYAGEDYEKRGGLRGFQGMRGKRGYDFDGVEQLKRAPSGFQGMRGKRGDDEEKSENNMENDDNSKNVGMKEVVGTTILPTSNIGIQLSALDNFGNSDMTSNLMDMHVVKRSPNYGFFGVRGKKMPYLSSYFGTRGKKGPFDYSFRGKFVGVRGKKSDVYQQYNHRLSLLEDYQTPRDSSGSFEIRAKRSPATDGSLVPEKSGNEE